MKTFKLCILFVVYATIVDAKPPLLVSKKQPFLIAASPPVGWSGPGYKAWPSYEIWSFSKGKHPTASFIEIRIDPARDSKLDVNTATAEQIKKTFDDFTNPEVERIGNAIIDQTKVVIWAIHNVDGELLIADLRHGGCDFHFSLRTNNPKELRQYQKTFLNVVNSVRILAKEPMSSAKPAMTPEH